MVLQTIRFYRGNTIKRVFTIFVFVGLASACTDAFDLCNRAQQCGWLGEPRPRGTSWPKSERVDTCRKLVNDLMDDTDSCLACNEKRSCADGPCDCLRGVLHVGFVDGPGR